MRYPEYRKENGGYQELGMGNRSCCNRASAGRNENVLKIDGSDAVNSMNVLNVTELSTEI